MFYIQHSTVAGLWQYKYKHFPRTMYYIWLLIIVTSCTASHCSDDSFITKKYTRTTYRVSDEDFDSLFTDAVVTRFRI